MVPPSSRKLPALITTFEDSPPANVSVPVTTSLREPRSICRPAAGTVIVQLFAMVQSPAPGEQSCVPPHCASAGADHPTTSSRATTTSACRERCATPRGFVPPNIADPLCRPPSSREDPSVGAYHVSP